MSSLEARPRGGRLEAPAADRNKAPILDQLRRLLPAGSGLFRILSVAEGTGTHAAYFVHEEPRVFVQPTDPGEASRDSIDAFRDELSEDDRRRLGAAVDLDVMNAAQWAAHGEAAWDIVTAINLVHISPEECTAALVTGAAAALRPGGALLLYGPFLVDGRPTTDSNTAFDAKLRAMDPRFGLRDVAAVTSAAALRGLVLEERVDMPANNFVLVFRKPPA